MKVKRNQKAISQRVGNELMNIGSDYTEEECVFLRAVAAYRVRKGLPFLGVRDYLVIMKELGYRQVPGTGA